MKLSAKLVLLEGMNEIQINNIPIIKFYFDNCRIFRFDYKFILLELIPTRVNHSYHKYIISNIV